MSRILIAEDDRDIGELIRHYLARAGHSAELVGSGSAVLPALREQPADLLILDLMLPGVDGLEICREVRADPALSQLPILMVTARAGEADRITGLEQGADDYVTKPFSPREVVARVAALLRRAGRTADQTASLRYGPLEIDRGRHLVRLDGREVQLTAKEFMLLEYFLEHRDRVLSRDLLLTDVWGYQYTGGTRTVDVHIRRLREKLPILATALVTVKQFGYRLEPVPPEAGAAET